MGAGGAFLILFVLAVLAVIVFVGLVLLAIGLVYRARGQNARPLLLAATGVLAFPAVLVLALAVWAQVVSDPDLSLDLREPVRASALPGEPDHPGIYELESDELALQLPKGVLFDSEVDGVTVWLRKGVVWRVDAYHRARDAEDLREAAADWSRQLGARLGEPRTVGGVEVSVVVNEGWGKHGRVRVEAEVG